MVAGVLFLFRKIVGALPLNGGAYNALFNTTKKSTASVAAALTVLSYMATAVISGSEAIKYLHSVWGVFPILPVTIVLLLVFCGARNLGYWRIFKSGCFHLLISFAPPYYIM